MTRVAADASAPLARFPAAGKTAAAGPASTAGEPSGGACVGAPHPPEPATASAAGIATAATAAGTGANPAALTGAGQPARSAPPAPSAWPTGSALARLNEPPWWDGDQPLLPLLAEIYARVEAASRAALARLGEDEPAAQGHERGADSATASAAQASVRGEAAPAFAAGSEGPPVDPSVPSQDPAPALGVPPAPARQPAAAAESDAWLARPAVAGQTPSAPLAPVAPSPPIPPPAVPPPPAVRPADGRAHPLMLPGLAELLGSVPPPRPSRRRR